jgi:hypothetical protein
MPLNLQKPHSGDKVKHLFLATEDPGAPGIEHFPYLYVEARIDFSDVRTGFRETVSLSKALEIYSNTADLLWIDDMVRDVDPQKVQSSVPDTVRLGTLPAFVDPNFISRMETQIIQYLLRSFVKRIYRNSYLNAYSFSGESRAEFAGRCLELLDGPKREELDLLREVFNRRLSQINEKYLGVHESDELEQARAESRDKNIFSHYSERIAQLFLLRSELLMNPVPGIIHNFTGVQELEERLLSLESEAQQAITKLMDSYEEKARALDEYILHPNLRDIHFARSCILWIPKRAA